ncbi:MAG: type II toxin-antitoxin system VapC family toxin [Pirellulales bacterium]|nr:type II toxin-antitoxin system VapC family toxin [Pirellulales bacterium]
MSLFVLDSDTLSLLENGHPGLSARIASHSATEISVAVIVVEEALSGWYSMIRKAKNPRQLALGYDELADTVSALSGIRILRYTEAAIARFHGLLKARLNVRANDLRIAAIALEHNAIVVTRNVRDFMVVPGLIVEDWSQP